MDEDGPRIDAEDSVPPVGDPNESAPAPEAVVEDVVLAPEAELEPEAEPASETASEPEPELEPETEPEPEAAPEPEPDVAAMPAADAPVAPATLDEMVAFLAEVAIAPQPESEEPAETPEELEAPEAPELEEPTEAAGAPEAPESEAAEVSEATEDAEASESATAESAVTEPGSEPELEPAEPLPLVRRLWTRLPSWLATAAFAAFTGTLVYLMWPTAKGPVATTDLYKLLVLGGAMLVLIDLVTGIIVWLVARTRAEQDEKGAVARKLWARAVGWTALGVALWWVGLFILDMRHAGFFG